MLRNDISRRTFALAGVAGAVALCAPTLSGCAGDADRGLPQNRRECYPTYQGTAPRACAVTAVVRDGKLEKVDVADTALTAPGYASVRLPYDAERVTSPLRKNAEGAFDCIDWDTACAEIGDALKDAARVAVVGAGGEDQEYYAQWLAEALGGEAYAQGGSSTAVSRAIRLATGYAGFVPDWAHGAAALIIGSGGDGDNIALSALAEAREQGAFIAVADARLTALGRLADVWLPIRPGTERAVVLAATRYFLTAADLDRTEAKATSDGYEALAKAVEPYTSSWASRLCGVPADQLETVFGRLAAAAPAASIWVDQTDAVRYGWGGDGETAYASCIANTLLGCWDRPGGAFLYDEPAAEGAASAGLSSVARAVKEMGDGAVQAVVFLDADPVGYLPGDKAASAMESTALSVAVTPFLTDTARRADYVLPLALSYESDRIPAVSAAMPPRLLAGCQAIAPVAEQALSLNDMVSRLAQAAGTGADAPSPSEASAPLLAPLGITWEGLLQAGSVPLPPARDTAGILRWPTATGKVQWAGAERASQGLPECPVWDEAAAVTGDAGVYRLLMGSVLSDETLESAAEGAPRCLWLNVEAANSLGVADGDVVKVTSAVGSMQLPVYATNRLAPGTVFVPLGSADWSESAEGGALPIAEFEFSEPWDACMAPMTSVTLEKVNA